MARPPCVLLVHGLGRTPVSFFPLAWKLRRAGVRCRFFAYWPPVESLSHIVLRLRSELRRVQPVVVVAHSLGGILTRLAHQAEPNTGLRHLVMVGPPNRPPRLAKHFCKLWPFRLLARSCGRFLATDDEYAKLPPPTCPVTVFAGTAGPVGQFSLFGADANDGVVSVDETRLADGHEPERIRAWHTTIMNHPAVLSRVLAIMAAPPPRTAHP